MGAREIPGELTLRGGFMSRPWMMIAPILTLSGATDGGTNKFMPGPVHCPPGEAGTTAACAAPTGAAVASRLAAAAAAAAVDAKRVRMCMKCLLVDVW
jgi:hypothetical protein